MKGPPRCLVAGAAPFTQVPLPPSVAAAFSAGTERAGRTRKRDWNTENFSLFFLPGYRIHESSQRIHSGPKTMNEPAGPTSWISASLEQAAGIVQPGGSAAQPDNWFRFRSGPLP